MLTEGESLKSVQIVKDNISVGELNAEYSVARLMSCFFSPALVDASPMNEEHVFNAETLKELGLEQKTASRPSKLKHMNLEQLQEELKSLEAAFKAYFLAEKKQNPSFSLKDIIDPEMSATLRSIHEAKRYIALRQEQAKRKL